MATVSVGVVCNNPPVAADDSLGTTDEDQALAFDASDLLANDSDSEGDPLRVSVVNQPDHGTVTPQQNGGFIYTPDANFNGADSFTYNVNDGHRNSDLATVSISVIAVNDAPVANDDTNYTALHDRPAVLDVKVNDTDVDGFP